MKVILWRMAHNCLPTGAQLQRRSIPTTYICPFCSREEPVDHVFLLCQYAKEIWEVMKTEFSIHLNLQNFVNMRQWLLDWLTEASDVDATVFTVCIWHIWEARNGARNGETMMHPRRVAEKIKAYVEMIMQFTFKSKTSNRCESFVSLPKWTPPPEGLVMINVDAAFLSDSGQMGAGVVIRDHHRECVAASRRSFHRVPEPELAEATAMRYALSFAAEAGFQKVIVASDCSSLVSKVKSPMLDRSRTGAIVSDIKKLASKFLSVSFLHVSRLCNGAAHAVAKSAVREACAVWVNDVPNVIRSIVCNEL